MTARRYSAEQRRRALELYAQLGAPETARRLGIPKPTVASWARRAGVRTDAADPARARERTEAARARWEELSEDRRQQLAGRLLGEVHDLLDQLQAPTLVRQVVTLAGGAGEGARAEVVDVELPRPTARDQRDRATAVAALVDRMQLLTGEATSRHALGDLDLEAELHAQQARDAELAELRRLHAVDDTGT